jgi:RimJ/RimL family protein N-acetyltransferase
MLTASVAVGCSPWRLPDVPDAATYSATARMRDGRSFRIRAQRPEDKADVLAAVARTSPQSLYRRFFGPKRFFSDQELAFFLHPDFVNHVCLVVVTEEDGHPVIVGGVRYIVQEPGRAEVSFAVIDEYQGNGIGTALMHHIAGIARKAGIRAFTAEVLPDNVPMLKVFEQSGLPIDVQREPEGVHVTLKLS